MARDRLEFARAVGLVIRRLREKRGLSQAQLGDVIGVSTGSVWKVEHGWNAMDIRTLRDYAEALGVRCMTILAEAEPRRHAQPRNDAAYQLASEHGVSLSTAVRWTRDPIAFEAWLDRKRLRDGARSAGIPMQVAYRRKSAGWTLAEIVSEPVRRPA
jgi:transcriptional regulator with XRE-family HTH domain